MTTNDGRPTPNAPAELARPPVGIYNVIGIPELGKLIMGFVASHSKRDLLNPSLASRGFYAASQSHIWQSISLPSTDEDNYWSHRPWARFSDRLDR